MEYLKCFLPWHVFLGCSDNDSDREVIKENLSSIARGQDNPPAEWEMLFGDEPSYDALTEDKNTQVILLHITRYTADPHLSGQLRSQVDCLYN